MTSCLCHTNLWGKSGRQQSCCTSLESLSTATGNQGISYVSRSPCSLCSATAHQGCDDPQLLSAARNNCNNFGWIIYAKPFKRYVAYSCWEDRALPPLLKHPKDIPVIDKDQRNIASSFFCRVSAFMRLPDCHLSSVLWGHSSLGFWGNCCHINKRSEILEMAPLLPIACFSKHDSRLLACEFAVRSCFKHQCIGSEGSCCFPVDLWLS